MKRGTPAQDKSYRRRRAVQALTTAALPIWLGALLYADRATDWLPAEQPERGRFILLSFFVATLALGVVQVATWRCPACGRWMSRGAFWTKRCANCETLFR